METPWSQYYKKEYDKTLITEKSVYELFKKCALSNSGYNALGYAKTRITYGELLKLVDSVAVNLSEKGLKKGSIISIISPVLPAVIALFLAANKIGAIVTLIEASEPDPQINKMLNDASSDCILVINSKLQNIKTIIEGTSVKTVIFCSDIDYLKLYDKAVMAFYKYKFQESMVMPTNNNIEGVTFVDWDEISQSKETVEITSTNPEDKALMLHRSSLMENREIEVFTNSAVIYTCKMIDSAFSISSLKDGNGVMCAMDYSYSGTFIGSFISMLCAGVMLVLIPYYHKDTYLKSVLINKPSILIGYPSSYTELVEKMVLHKYRNKNLSFIQLMIAAGTSFVTARRKYCEEVLEKCGCAHKIIVCYGLAECLSTCSFVPESSDKNNSIGVPFPGVMMKIMDSKGMREVSTGEKGEICVCHDGVLDSVVGAETALSQILRKHRDGRMWIHTSDIGHVDEDGFFYFDYVEKRCTKIKGVSVSFRQIEDVIKGVYGVFDACVVDYIDEYGDTNLVALVVPIESYMSDNDKLISLVNSIEQECEMMLAPLSRPTEIEYRAYFPRISSGIDYNQLTREITEKKLTAN